MKKGFIGDTVFVGIKMVCPKSHSHDSQMVGMMMDYDTSIEVITDWVCMIVKSTWQFPKVLKLKQG
jgi:hypothetical protein